jgi:hypothetical protein
MQRVVKSPFHDSPVLSNLKPTGYLSGDPFRYFRHGRVGHVLVVANHTLSYSLAKRNIRSSMAAIANAREPCKPHALSVSEGAPVKAVGSEEGAVVGGRLDVGIYGKVLGDKDAKAVGSEEGSVVGGADAGIVRKELGEEEDSKAVGS